jgi:hypothetical protein
MVMVDKTCKAVCPVPEAQPFSHNFSSLLTIQQTHAASQMHCSHPPRTAPLLHLRCMQEPQLRRPLVTAWLQNVLQHTSSWRLPQGQPYGQVQKVLGTQWCCCALGATECRGLQPPPRSPPSRPLPRQGLLDLYSRSQTLVDPTKGAWGHAPVPLQGQRLWQLEVWMLSRRRQLWQRRLAKGVPRQRKTPN